MKQNLVDFPPAREMNMSGMRHLLGDVMTGRVSAHTPSMPERHQLGAKLEYQVKVNELLRDVPKPAGQMGSLAAAEFAVLPECYYAGLTPEQFVSLVLDVRAATQRAEMAGVA